MNRMFYPLAALLLLLASAFTYDQLEGWEISKDYSVKFSGKFASGSFKTMKGDIVFDEQQPDSSRFDITIDVASINTGIKLKNKHARSAAWFDAAKYPYIRYTAAAAVKTETGYSTTGELDMHGIKKPLTIPFTFERSGDSGIFKGTFKVNRCDFGISEPQHDETDSTTLVVTVPVLVKK